MADFLPRGYLTLSKWTHPTQLHHHRHQEGGPNWGSTTRPLCDSSLALSPRPSNLRVSSCFFITIYIRLKPLKCSSGNDNNDNHNKICFNFIPPSCPFGPDATFGQLQRLYCTVTVNRKRLFLSFL